VKLTTNISLAACLNMLCSRTYENVVMVWVAFLGLHCTPSCLSIYFCFLEWDVKPQTWTKVWIYAGHFGLLYILGLTGDEYGASVDW
jgi:hypothetical protein